MVPRITLTNVHTTKQNWYIFKYKYIILSVSIVQDLILWGAQIKMMDNITIIFSLHVSYRVFAVSVRNFYIRLDLKPELVIRFSFVWSLIHFYRYLLLYLFRSSYCFTVCAKKYEPMEQKMKEGNSKKLFLSIYFIIFVGINYRHTSVRPHPPIV